MKPVAAIVSLTVKLPPQTLPMARLKRAIRLKNITELARQTSSRVWAAPMPPGWKVYLVRKTVVQQIHGRRVCGVIIRNSKTILIGRNTDHYSFHTLVHELAHLRTIDEEVDHGPMWQHEFHKVARPILGSELERDI
jgi:hypothetical protein